MNKEKHVYYLEYMEYGNGWDCGIRYGYDWIIAKNEEEAKSECHTPRPEDIKIWDLGTTAQFNQMVVENCDPNELIDYYDSTAKYFRDRGIKVIINK